MRSDLEEVVTNLRNDLEEVVTMEVVETRTTWYTRFRSEETDVGPGRRLEEGRDPA